MYYRFRQDGKYWTQEYLPLHNINLQQGELFSGFSQGFFRKISSNKIYSHEITSIEERLERYRVRSLRLENANKVILPANQLVVSYYYVRTYMSNNPVLFPICPKDIY